VKTERKVKSRRTHRQFSNKLRRPSAEFSNQCRDLPTYIDDKHAIAHNKIMIIDKATVITGSFNFTKAAEEKNAENVLIIKDKPLAKVYIENWEKHKGHSENY
jgi:phosphatidylserine/phosphatidylglycerophosphate/cardiolipin synthase-like enzyme